MEDGEVSAQLVLMVIVVLDVRGLALEAPLMRVCLAHIAQFDIEYTPIHISPLRRSIFEVDFLKESARIFGAETLIVLEDALRLGMAEEKVCVLLAGSFIDVVGKEVYDAVALVSVDLLLRALLLRF